MITGTPSHSVSKSKFESEYSRRASASLAAVFVTCSSLLNYTTDSPKSSIIRRLRPASPHVMTFRGASQASSHPFYVSHPSIIITLSQYTTDVTFYNQKMNDNKVSDSGLACIGGKGFSNQRHHERPLQMAYWIILLPQSLFPTVVFTDARRTSILEERGGIGFLFFSYYFAQPIASKIASAMWGADGRPPGLCLVIR